MKVLLRIKKAPRYYILKSQMSLFGGGDTHPEKVTVRGKTKTYMATRHKSNAKAPEFETRKQAAKTAAKKTSVKPLDNDGRLRHTDKQEVKKMDTKKEVKLTAYSEKSGKEWPVSVGIAKNRFGSGHGVSSVTIDVDGKNLNGQLVQKQGSYCIRLKGDSAAPFGHSDVTIKLRENEDAVKSVIKNLDREETEQKIKEMRDEGRLRYYISEGTGRPTFGIGNATDREHSYESLTSHEVPDSLKLFSLKGQPYSPDDNLAHHSGGLWIISKEHYDGILKDLEDEGRATKKAEEDNAAELKKRISQAKETGKRVELYKYVTGPCEEEGCIDTNVVYAMPDGTKKTQRYHSY